MMMMMMMMVLTEAERLLSIQYRPSATHYVSALQGRQMSVTCLSPVSIQTQSLALRALRKRKPQETQALALARSQSWLPLLRPSIPIGLRLNGNRALFLMYFLLVADPGPFSAL